MTLRLRLEPRARSEILTARKWWRANRPAAPQAFDEELEHAFRLIRSMPDAGQPVASPRHSGMRRVLLSRVHYHLYYRVTDDIAEVLALWHTSRGHGPGL